jgi:flagella basal body P-ring formation protein FlgA
VRCVAPQAWTTYVQASLSIQGYYYVANRNINVGDTLGLDDLAAREGDILRLSNGVVFDPSQVVGYIAQQRIAVGAPVKSSALRDAASIVRGQAVRTEARGVGFVAHGEGQALQGGAPGAQIQVRTSSGQVVTGTVVNATTVQVAM